MSDIEDSSCLYTPCPSLTSEYETDQLIVTCKCGGRFFARCCCLNAKSCHQLRIVYMDGACSNNGNSGAVSSIGIAFGIHEGEPDDEETCQFSLPVDDRLDPKGKRTNQRAELLAALEGLKKICDYDEGTMSAHLNRRRTQRKWSPLQIIVTTDSEYVVKGATQWLPNWKSNGIRKPNGQRPSNLDLFCILDAEVEERERRHGCKVKFWHISREYNIIADQLARRGTRVLLLLRTKISGRWSVQSAHGVCRRIEQDMKVSGRVRDDSFFLDNIPKALRSQRLQW